MFIYRIIVYLIAPTFYSLILHSRSLLLFIRSSLIVNRSFALLLVFIAYRSSLHSSLSSIISHYSLAFILAVFSLFSCFYLSLLAFLPSYCSFPYYSRPFVHNNISLAPLSILFTVF